MEDFRPCDALGALAHGGFTCLAPFLFLRPSCSNPLLSRLKPCYRHTDCPSSLHRAVKTTAYAAPRQLSPRSGPGPYIAGVASYCFQDIVSLFRTFFLSPVRLELPLSLFQFPFLLSHQTRDDAPPFTRS